MWSEINKIQVFNIQNQGSKKNKNKTKPLLSVHTGMCTLHAARPVLKFSVSLWKCMCLCTLWGAEGETYITVQSLFCTPIYRKPPGGSHIAALNLLCRCLFTVLNMRIQSGMPIVWVQTRSMVSSYLSCRVWLITSWLWSSIWGGQICFICYFRQWWRSLPQAAVITSFSQL